MVGSIQQGSVPVRLLHLLIIHVPRRRRRRPPPPRHTIAPKVSIVS